MIEVAYRRFHEWFPEHRDYFLSFFLADHCQTIDVVEVMDSELRVRPQRAGTPAIKTGHID